MKHVLVFLVLMVFPAFGMAATIHVPGDQPTIQQGIDAAADGDTVLVAPGTYVENIDFIGKAITVISEQGPEVTIIDGGSPSIPDIGSVVTFQSGEGLDSILEGFTVTNGTGTFTGPYVPGYRGGGILVVQSSPTITGNIITGNTCSDDYSLGGGIFAYISSPTITANTISWNNAHIGGGIYAIHDNSSMIADNTITDNTAPYAGGGIALYIDCHPVIMNNDISRNVCETLEYYGGGGIGMDTQCSPTIIGNTISDNVASFVGGGIDIQNDCQPVITNNSFTGNSALYGGGIYCWAGYEIQPPTVNNNIFIGNSADIGGALSLNRCNSMVLSNNTIADNDAISWGAGIECYWSSLVMLNTILWNNTAPTGPEIWVGSVAELTISYSDVEGGEPAVYVEPTSTLNWGGGMIDADPLFWNGPDGDCYLQQDPCQPGVVNPCVNTGHPFSPLIDGTTGCLPDVVRVDMGYHYALLDTVTADLGCVPDSGVLPFATQFSVTLGNAVTYERTVAGRIDVTLAGGATYQSWRAGFTNLGPNETFVTAWIQTLPALGSLVGSNVFELHAEDVTPPPFNQPPYPPSGDTDTATCTVTGIAP